MIDVAPSLNVRPHPVVHRGNQQNLRLRGEEAGGEQIIRETVRGATEKISRRRSDDNELRFAREPDMIQRVARTEDLSMDWPARNSFERDWSNELARTASHHDVDFSSCLRKQTRQPH